MDNYIETSTANNITTLNVFYKGIEDMTGIEDFINLTYLNCGSNFHNTNNNTLDVSQCTKLTSLYCGNANISNLNISNITFLDTLDCWLTDITSLDISHNNGLTYLHIFGCYELYCIQVSSLLNTSNWTVANSLIEPQHYFSEQCP